MKLKFSPYYLSIFYFSKNYFFSINIFTINFVLKKPHTTLFKKSTIII